MRLEGKVAVVTGASRGIGRAIALRLARDGALVCVNYHSNTEAAQAVVGEIKAAGGEAFALQADVGSVESLFFHKDPQSAAKLGHARGVVLCQLARAGMEVHEYPPARVKSTVAGHGRASKGQIVQMIQRLLTLDVAPREDAADALALAFTYVRRAPIERVLAARTAAAR
jgi:crossover junction endodeoxyribonuclease RuvC